MAYTRRPFNIPLPSQPSSAPAMPSVNDLPPELLSILYHNVSNKGSRSGSPTPPDSVPTNVLPTTPPRSGNRTEWLEQNYSPDTFQHTDRNGNASPQGYYGYHSGSDLDTYLLHQMLGWQQDKDPSNALAQTAQANWLNRQLALDDRSYNSPQQQIQRLMASGVSREAALALVNGSAGASNVQQVNPIPAQQGELAEAQADQIGQDMILNPINTAFNGIQSVTGLFGAAMQGLSIPGIIANNTIAQNNAYASDLIRSAKDGIGAMNGVLSSARSLGQLTDEDVKSPDSIQDWFTRQTPETNGAAHDFVQSGQLQNLYENPFGRTAIDDNFCTLRNPERVNAEIDNAMQELEFRRLHNAGKKVENAMLKIRKSFEETQEARARMDFVDWQKVHDTYNEAYRYELEQRLVELSQIRDPKVKELVASRMFNREQMQAALWQLQAELYQHALDTEGNYDEDVAATRYLCDRLGFTDSELGRTFTPLVVGVTTAVRKAANGVKNIYNYGKDFIKNNKPEFGEFAPPGYVNQIYQ